MLVPLLAVLASSALPQVRVLLYDFEPRGVELPLIRTNTQLLRDALNGTYKFIVIDPASGSTCYGVAAAAESARAYGADNALVGNIMSIGGQQILTYQLVDATSGAMVLQDKVRLPEMHELPTVAERIALSLAERRPYGETVEPEKMTSPEIAPRFRHPRQPYTSLFLTAGYLYHLQRRPHPEPDPNFFATSLVNLNMAVTFETQQMLTMLQVGLMRGTQEETDIAFDIFGNYVFGKGDFAPIAGGGIGITRYTWTENYVRRHNDGLSLSAGAGMLGLRTYYFRLIAAGYINYTIASAENWGGVPGFRVMFGVTTPTLGPDATVKIPPGCVGAAIGGFFLTGLIIALTQ